MHQKEWQGDNNLDLDESRLLIYLTRPLVELILAFASLGILVFYASALYFGRAYDGMYLTRGINVVDRVVPGSPVEQAGIRAGDVVLGIDGRWIDPRLLTPAIPPKARPGSTLIYTLQRGGTIFQTSVILSDDLSHDTAQYLLVASITLLAFIFWWIGFFL